MKVFKLILTIIAVAATVTAKSENLNSVNYLIQVKELSAQFESTDKKNSLEKLCILYANSQITKEVLLEYTNVIAQSQNNIDIILYALELTSKTSGLNEIFLGIAKAASENVSGSEYFMDLLNHTYLNYKK